MMLAVAQAGGRFSDFGGAMSYFLRDKPRKGKTSLRRNAFLVPMGVYDEKMKQYLVRRNGYCSGFWQVYGDHDGWHLFRRSFAGNVFLFIAITKTLKSSREIINLWQDTFTNSVESVVKIFDDFYQGNGLLFQGVNIKIDEHALLTTFMAVITWREFVDGVDETRK
jgi:hypothetical protein